MDHVKKLVYTIVGCLTIVSLTFTICTKIGHCATGGGSGVSVINTFPLPVGSGFGCDFVLTQQDIDAILNAPTDFDSSFPQIDMITFYDYYPHNNQVEFTAYYNPVLTSLGSDSDFLSLNGSICSIHSGGSYTGFWRGRVDLNTHTSWGNWYNADGEISSVSWFSSTPSGFTLKLNENLYSYPIWIRNSNSYFTNGGSFSGHSKGGVLSNYIDSDDLLEQDSSLPSVDTSPPADTSSNPAWYQKILNGMGKINQSIQGGVLTIGDYLGQIKEDIENAIAWITEPPDSDEILDNVEPYLAENDLISGFLSSKTAIQGVYNSIGNVPVKTRSQMVWDIPFNLPSMSQTFHARIDFGWYENIRSTFEPFLNMFLCIGFLFSFIRSIPGILHGNSGEGDT